MMNEGGDCPRASKDTKGFTLLEAVIALAVWMVLSISVIMIWHHVSERGTELLARQNAFENARVALDVLIVNIEMANNIQLTVGSGNTLRTLRVTQRRPTGHVWNYYFQFSPSAGTRHRLQVGGNEIARDIEQIIIEPINNTRLRIVVTTICDCSPTAINRCAIILEGNVDIRYKRLSGNGFR